MLEKIFRHIIGQSVPSPCNIRIKPVQSKELHPKRKKPPGRYHMGKVIHEAQKFAI